MKKAIITILLAIMILSLTACGSPSVQKDTVQQTGIVSPTLEPTAQPTAEITPSPEPTPTPQPTLSEEELAKQQAMEEYEILKHYHETYGDLYALVLIRDMADEGLIEEKLIEELDDTGITQRFSELSEGYLNFKMSLEKEEKYLNGRAEELNEYDIKKVLKIVSDSCMYNIVNISAFDTQESRDRVENGIILLNSWFANPSISKQEEVIEMFFEGDLLPGEIMVLKKWFYSNPNTLEKIEKDGVIYTRLEYLELIQKPYGKCLMEYFHLKTNELYELNSTPNPDDYIPKDWLTPEKIDQILNEHNAGISWPVENLPDYIPEIEGVMFTSVAEDGSWIEFKGASQQIIEDYIEALNSYGWDTSSPKKINGGYVVEATYSNGDTMILTWEEPSVHGVGSIIIY